MLEVSDIQNPGPIARLLNLKTHNY